LRTLAAVRDPEQERLERAERQNEIAKWQEVCKPVFKADEYGVRRASYAGLANSGAPNGACRSLGLSCCAC
jgi:hypothetical protein